MAMRLISFAQRFVEVANTQRLSCLAEESEYAAWVIYNRYYLNHFTVSVHNLEDGYNTIGRRV